MTLTANVENAPSGRAATYRWEEKTGGSWRALASTAETVSVSSSASDVRTFRVTVSYGSQSTTATVTIVWDELAIIGDLIDAAVADLTMPPSPSSAATALSRTMYGRAETAFVNCVNNDSRVTVTHDSISSIMAAYTGDTRTVAEKCDAKHGTLNSIQAAFKTKFGEISKQTGTATAAHRAWLTTEQGKLFVTSVADPEVARLVAGILSSASGSGFSGQQGGSPATGVNCFNDIDEDSTQAEKYNALNCIVFKTPHNFWVQMQEGNQPVRNAYLRAFCNDPNPVWGEECNERKFDWIHVGDVRCSTPGFTIAGVRVAVPRSWVGANLAACLKHDLTWNGLQGIIGGTSTGDDGRTTNEDDKTLDRAWGPRNKALADYVFHLDNLCDARTGQARSVCIDSEVEYWSLNARLAIIALWGVADWNDNNWPTTSHDIAHVRANQEYMPCDVPRLEHFNFTLSHTTTTNGATKKYYKGTAKLVMGCVTGITITDYHWETTTWPKIKKSFDPDSFTIPYGHRGIIVTLTPSDVSYGGARYLQLRGVPE